MKYLLTAIESERLKFRALEESDFSTWLKFFQDPRWNKYWLVRDLSPEEHCQRWFDKIFYRYENDLGGMNVLIDKESNVFVGQCGLLIQTVDGKEELEVAYSLLQAHWGKGYATEAARKCIDFAFGNNYRDSLISIIHDNNVESEMVARRNGLYVDRHTTYDNNAVRIFRIDKPI